MEEPMRHLELLEKEDIIKIREKMPEKYSLSDMLAEYANAVRQSLEENADVVSNLVFNLPTVLKTMDGEEIKL